VSAGGPERRPESGNRRRGGRLGPLSTAWIVVRVSVVVALWLLLFLAVFMGYLTIPIVLVSTFLLFYSLMGPVGALLRRPRGGRKGGGGR
jgi:hypothetical protein